MAKSFLKDYTIGKDIIDNVTEENFPLASESEPEEKEVNPPAGTETEEKTADKKAKITVRKEGLFTVFETGGTSYRIGGVKPLLPRDFTEPGG